MLSAGAASNRHLVDVRCEENCLKAILKSTPMTTKAMKILLVQPPVHLDDLYGELAGAGSELAPQGLCSIATIARKNGFDVSILDAEALKLSVRETIRQIEASECNIIGFTLYTTFIPVVKKIAANLKALNKKERDRPIILAGGSHVTIRRQHVFEDIPELDIACLGEGEITFVEILKALQENKPLSEVNGLAYRDADGKIVVTDRRPFIQNMDSLPLPDWNLLPQLTKYYRPAGDSIKRSPSAGIVTSRGCNGKCYFCNPWQLGKTNRFNSAGYVYAMVLDLMRNYGIQDIYIQDDSFLLHKENVKEFCRLIIKNRLDLTWACHGRVDHVDMDLLRLMKESGCWQIAFGIESGAQKILDNINKGTTVEQNFSILEMCRRVKLDVKGLFMIGCFGETHATIQETIDFIKKAYITDFHMNFFTPLPLTAAMRLWPKYGNFDPGKGFFMGNSPSFVPHGLSEAELIAYRKRIYRMFYLRPGTIAKYAIKLTDLKSSRKLLLSAHSFLKYILKKSLLPG